jgi:SAM-dependent methyltransferase
MYLGFPSAHVPLLRCPRDAGPLTSTAAPAGEHITDGELRCTSCDRRFPVAGGIVGFLLADELDDESARERALRDEHAGEEYAHSAERSGSESGEMGPMLAALGPDPASVVLELGCGTGRYTTVLAGRCRTLLAVDFSLASLRELCQRRPLTPAAGLVHADITRLNVAPRQFTHCLSTLVSNLPTRDHRVAMYRLAATALRDDGRFVFGTHYHDIRRRWRKVAQAGRYGEGIYVYYFRRPEMVNEVRPFFRRVRARPIAPVLPLAGRLGLPAGTLSRIAERVPVVRELGRLLLVAAEQPVREPGGRPAGGGPGGNSVTDQPPTGTSA